ncbi:nicotinate-nucleotide diphosphorylase (carboxylating), partial [Gelidibacter salicanalis]|nr:nicotinate-nucleotide diphosphorylase (carboxylating) [Gelidibacter salicanalis]
GDGDHTSLSTIPQAANGKARLIVKDEGILAGVELAKHIFRVVDEGLSMEVFIEDGMQVKYGDIAFHVIGKDQSILTAERL